MTFTATQSFTSFDNSLDAVSNATVAFERLSTDEKLGVLWEIYANMGGMITSAATGAATLQFAQGLLDSVQALSPEQQLGFMRDLVTRTNTDLTRAYGVLTNNTKLAFWFQLAEWMRAGKVIQVPDTFALSSTANAVFSQISMLEFNQQITLLRKAVVAMGFDPLA